MLLFLSWMACSVFFGTSYIAANFLTKYPISLEYMMLYRMMFSCIAIGIIALLTNKRLLIKKQELIPSILVSTSQLSVLLATYGTKYVISGIVPCVTILQIFVAELLSAIVEKRKMRKNVVISGYIGFIGIIMLCNQSLVGLDNIDTKNTIIGIMFSFISTFVSAGGNMIYEKNKTVFSNMPHITFLFYNCCFVSIFFLLFGLIFSQPNTLFNLKIIDVKYCFVVIWLSITATIIALLALYYIIEKQGAVKATYMNFILPIISMIISTFVENFSWNFTTFVGMIILMYGVWIGIRTPVEKKTSFFKKFKFLRR